MGTSGQTHIKTIYSVSVPGTLGLIPSEMLDSCSEMTKLVAQEDLITK
jgi:hypothetical protein